MDSINIDNVLDNLYYYNQEEKNLILKAFLCANDLHFGQKRQSGEDYIIHPLNVAYILSQMNADCDTVCAGLLHDVIEDTSITKEEISNEFNENIASLVDGVTKISKMNFSSKEAQNHANIRKIITGITKDVRIIIIKLADRLHNMRTLSFKSEYKQKENSIETLDIFVPLAYYTGAYRIKNELEDLSFKYLKPEEYKTLSEKKYMLEISNEPMLNEMILMINDAFIDENINHEIKSRMKNIYGIYKKLEKGHKFSDIHDLYSLKIMVDDIKSCYQSLGIIHSLYKPVNNMFKDYICAPKTNMYKSLHTTVFAPNERLVQTQIRTQDMDEVASFGLFSYWKNHGGEDAREFMQKEISTKYQFYDSLFELDKTFLSDKDFVSNIKTKLFSDKIYVYNSKGESIELPLGSSVFDYSFHKYSKNGMKVMGAYVNESPVDLDYILNNKDRVRILARKL